jgi:beta-lactam-binding protein with PASTA domain
LLGNIQYVPDIQQNAVLKQLVNNREIAAGTAIAKGTKVDLVVGDGYGNQEFDVPSLVGKPLDEASIVLQGSGLQIGVILYESNASVPEGSIIKQKPNAGNKIRVGDVVDVWVSGPDPANFPINENE